MPAGGPKELLQFSSCLLLPIPSINREMLGELQLVNRQGAEKGSCSQAMARLALCVALAVAGAQADVLDAATKQNQAEKVLAKLTV